MTEWQGYILIVVLCVYFAAAPMSEAGWYTKGLRIVFLLSTIAMGILALLCLK